eukprot:2069603-Amphidinium_carterae.1
MGSLNGGLFFAARAVGDALSWIRCACSSRSDTHSKDRAPKGPKYRQKPTSLNEVSCSTAQLLLELKLRQVIVGFGGDVAAY